MRLRKLELKDAPLMLEWMHDPSVVAYLRTDFLSKTIEDCNSFIQASQTMPQDLHLAVVDEHDIYMGTVSLKHITDTTAEFAVTVRTAAMGKGFSKFAMSEMIRIGLEDLGLAHIYWCVSRENPRAVRFYEKYGYQKINPVALSPVGYSEEEIENYSWYCQDKPDEALDSHSRTPYSQVAHLRCRGRKETV